MYRRRYKIGSLLLLVLFLIGTVGLNIDQQYCFCCQKSTTYIKLLPDEDHSCLHFCSEHKDEGCDEYPQKHDFFKIVDEWTISSSNISFELVAQVVESILVPEILIIINNQYSNSIPLYIDVSPLLEELCTYRC